MTQLLSPTPLLVTSGQDTENYAKLAEELWAYNNDDGSESIFLPAAAPKVIEEALLGFQSIGI